MKKNILKVMSLVLALMLVLTSSAFAAYTVDELSGVNAPVKIKDGIEKDPAIGVNIVENVKPYLISSSASNSAKYDAATDTYSGISMATFTNLLTFRKQDGLKYDLGCKYLVSFDILVDTVNTTKPTIFTFMRAKGDGTGRTDDTYTRFVIPVNATAGKYRHVEFVYDLTNATERGENKDDFCLWISEEGVADGTLNIANFRIEKYIPSTPAANLLRHPVSAYHVVTEFPANAVNGWDNIVGWEDGKGVTMQGGRKYRFTANIEIPTALTAQKQVRLTRATVSWTNRSNNYSAIHVIPAGTSGNYIVDMVLDFTAISDITDGGKYTGLLFVAESNFGQNIVVSAPKLYDITEEFAVYQRAGENILGAPLTVDDAKYSGLELPSRVTLTKLANSPNAMGWKYTDEFKLIQGKKYTLSFDWSVPSTPDTDKKTINWALSDANPNADFKGWTGRGDYVAQNEAIRAWVSKDSLSGSVTYDFVYNPSDVSGGIVLWVTSASTSATEYTLSNIKIAPKFEEIDIQKDGNEIVVIQNKKNANSFNDLIILAEYEGETLKSFDFTTPETIAEMNDEATIALRAKLSNVGAGSTVKMFRWSNFNTLDPVAAPVDVK